MMNTMIADKPKLQRQRRIFPASRGGQLIEFFYFLQLLIILTCV